jgi:hypothetical protein
MWATLGGGTIAVKQAIGLLPTKPRAVAGLYACFPKRKRQWSTSSGLQALIGDRYAFDVGPDSCPCNSALAKVYLPRDLKHDRLVLSRFSPRSWPELSWPRALPTLDQRQAQH